MRELGLVFIAIYIYRGFYSNFMVTGSYPGRVLDFLNKIRTRPGPASGFFFLKHIPDPILYQAG